MCDKTAVIDIRAMGHCGFEMKPLNSECCFRVFTKGLNNTITLKVFFTKKTVTFIHVFTEKTIFTACHHVTNFLKDVHHS